MTDVIPGSSSFRYIMEPWRSTLIKQEPLEEAAAAHNRTTRASMGLSRIMSGPSTTSPAPTPTRSADSDKSSASAKPPAPDIILSTLHHLLDPDLQPPPPRSQRLPRRPSDTAQSPKSSATSHAKPASVSSSGWGSASTPSSSSVTSSETSGQQPRTASTRPGVANSATVTGLSFPAGQSGQPVPWAYPVGLDPAAIQHLLQASTGGLSPQALLAALASGLVQPLPGLAPAPAPSSSPSSSAGPHSRQGVAPQPYASANLTSLSGSHTSSSSSSSSGPSTSQGPHIPDPLYPRPLTNAKPLPPPPKTHSPSFMPSVTSAFTQLRRSPPSSPNPPPQQHQQQQQSSLQPQPKPGAGNAPAPAAAALPDFAASVAAMLNPQAAADYMRMQYMQLILALQQQQQQQQYQAPLGYAAASLPFPGAAPMVPMITTTTATHALGAGLDRSPSLPPSASPPLSLSSFPPQPTYSATASSSLQVPKSEGADRSPRRHSRGREDFAAGSFGVGGPTGRKRRREDALGHSPTRDPVLGAAGGHPQGHDDVEGGGAFGEEDDAVKRKRINQNQLDVLEAAYLDDPLPSRRTKQRLSGQLGISIKRVQIWFQNRRAKQKRQKKDGSDGAGSDHFLDEDGSDDPPSSGMFGLMD